jgi:tetratricopeptide (TPR) repeat protein
VTQESPRIAELRRRVHADPASIAFAQLAEEYRRAGQHHEAVKYCRAGLGRHPGYLSARVTLGRSLTEIGELDDAAREFDLVLRSAPDNLVAIRSLAEIHQRRGSLEAALEYYTRALALARFDPELEEGANRIARELGRAASVTPDGLSFEEASSQLLSAASRLPGVEPHQADVQTAAPSSTADSTSESLVDFDVLLASFGMPDASPPPVVERLLSEPPEPSAAAEPVLPAPVLAERPVHSVAADPFATLEQELRSFEQRPSAAPAVLEALCEEAHVPIHRTNDLVVEELEAWLRVLRDDASASPSL